MRERCTDAVRRYAAAPLVVAPTFAGSFVVGGADADFISAGTLIDVKATVQPTIPTRSLRQIVSYALLDCDDTYGIDTVGLLAVRQGTLITWPFNDLLTEMAGQPSTAADLRDVLRQALTS